MILISAQAAEDIRWIDSSTAMTWGEAQAEKYLAFLNSELELLESHPMAGAKVQGLAGLRCRVMRTRRQAHGHRIFYRPVADGIEVIRVLHTALNWRQVLDQDDSG